MQVTSADLPAQLKSARVGEQLNDSPVTLTFLKDRTGCVMAERAMRLPKLVDAIAYRTATDKAELPLLKQGRFGPDRTLKGSLRSNSNLVSVTGLEADYDEGVVSFADAVAVLRDAGIRGIAYTSPSYRPDKPKWRVLTPFSREYPPDQRDLYMARLSGLFGGIFASESWTLSQCYFFGSVGSNPDHAVVLVDGDFIDLRDDLPTIGRPQPPVPPVIERPVFADSPKTAQCSARWQAFIACLTTNISLAPEGSKRKTLIKNAIAMGGILDQAGISQGHALDLLLDALNKDSVKDWAAAKEAAEWGLAQGMARPIQDRPYGEAR